MEASRSIFEGRYVEVWRDVWVVWRVGNCKNYCSYSTVSAFAFMWSVSTLRRTSFVFLSLSRNIQCYRYPVGGLRDICGKGKVSTVRPMDRLNAVRVPVISSGNMESRTSRSSICSSRPIFPYRRDGLLVLNQKTQGRNVRNSTSASV